MKRLLRWWRDRKQGRGRSTGVHITICADGEAITPWIVTRKGICLAYQ